ncbi:sensor histidine kinase [Nonomuraea sp. NPDC050328]|uniref:sensor histidine kinase n=1 Tax=Nonomuraea sp. NPDC050328 TaxID=3364361 RepID=UPI0037A86287
MPDHLPLEEQAGRMSSAGPHAWERLWGWEVLLAFSLVLPSGYVLLSDRPQSEQLVVAGCLLAILPLYAFVGRPAIVSENLPRSVVYLVLMTVLFAPPALLLSASTFALFGLCPQFFIALPARRAVIGPVVLATMPMLQRLGQDEPLEAWFDLLVILTTVIVFSSVFGVWVERIRDQSRERAELIAELESSRAEVARLSAEAGARGERERLAGEIHDTLAQGFSSIIMLLQAPDPRRNVPLAVQTARENLAEARALVAALAPAPLDSSTLLESMRRITARTGEETGADTAFATEGETRALPPGAEVVLIRALQEGLANVRKHAGAGRVRVTLGYGTREVALTVTDDGRGFDPALAEGYGLRAMRGRVEQVGGSVEVASTPGRGTRLTVEVPA